MAEPLVNRIFREGTRRGIGGSSTWAGVAVAAGAVRVIRRIASPPPEVAWRQAMEPGDRFEVVVKPAPPTRRMRRKAKKKAAKADRRTARKAARKDRRGRK
jgi:hypothetical protein